MPRPSRILVLEGPPQKGVPIATHLRAAGYQPAWRHDAQLASSRLDDLDLVILDLLLPSGSGLDVLKELRRASDVPLLIVTARGDTAAKVRAFELGADDYLTQPYSPEELVARVRARLRRPRLRREDGVIVGALHLLPTARRATLRGAPLALTRVELDLLLTLGRRPGEAMSRACLVERALDQTRDGDERTLDVHFSRLRKKLGKGWIETVWGVGYRLTEGPAPRDVKLC